MKKRSPSQVRNMLEVRVRRLAASKGDEIIDEALSEIIEIASQALEDRKKR